MHNNKLRDDGEVAHDVPSPQYWSWLATGT